jgi:hypothetical protein
MNLHRAVPVRVRPEVEDDLVLFVLVEHCGRLPQVTVDWLPS